MNDATSILQLAGGLVLAVGYVPQIVRIVRSRSAEDLSLSMWGSVVLGLLMMEAYALDLAGKGEPFYLVTNSISLAFSLCLVTLILAFGRFRGRTAALRRAVRGRRRA